MASLLIYLKPDYIFLTSDRFETLAVATVAHILKNTYNSSRGWRCNRGWHP